MKKKLVRLTALVLALAMSLCVCASAADGDKVDENTLATIYGYNGAVVSFATDGEKEERVTVTYESADIKVGQFYLVMVIADDGEGNYVPTKDTILYINQTVGVAGTGDNGKIVFGTETENAIYPSTIKDSAILIYGTNVDGTASSLKAAVLKGKYVIGDVNNDKRVNTRDALLILQHVVGITTLTDEQKLPANTNGDKNVNTRDALLILQLVVGIITEL